jgi:hypothetical protein
MNIPENYNVTTNNSYSVYQIFMRAYRKAIKNTCSCICVFYDGKVVERDSNFKSIQSCGYFKDFIVIPDIPDPSAISLTAKNFWRSKSRELPISVYKKDATLKNIEDWNNNKLQAEVREITASIPVSDIVQDTNISFNSGISNKPLPTLWSYTG